MGATSLWTIEESTVLIKLPLSYYVMVQENDNHGGPRFLTFEELESIYDEHITPAIQKNIIKGSTLKSDGASSYAKAKELIL